MSIDVRLYSAANGFLQTIDRCFDRSWQDVLDDIGSGKIAVLADDADANDLTRQRLVKFEWNGTVVAGFVIGPRRQTTIALGEESEEVLQVAGLGFMSLLARAFVEPQLGLGRTGPDFRSWNYSNPEFDDSGWAAMVELSRQDDPLSLYGTLNPEGWPDGGACWIWTVAPDLIAVPPTPVGDIYTRAPSFTLADEGDVALFVTADDGWVLNVDGAEVASETSAFLWKRTRRVDIFLDAGDHTIAIKATNIDRPSSPATNGAALLFAAYTTVSGGELGTLILHSDSTWVGVGYPAVVPAMTWGHVFRLLLEEAHARGVIPEVTQGSFTDTVDSDGNAYTTLADYGSRVGTSMLDTLRAAMAVAVDAEVTAGPLELEIYNKGTLGGATSVVFVKGTHIENLSHDEQEGIGTSYLARGADGRYVVVATGLPGRVIESFVELGSAAADETLDEVVAAIVADHDPWIRATLDVLPDSAGETMYVNFRTGSVVDLPAMGGGTDDARILSMTVTDRSVTEDGIEDGDPRVTLEARQEV